MVQATQESTVEGLLEIEEDSASGDFESEDSYTEETPQATCCTDGADESEDSYTEEEDSYVRDEEDSRMEEEEVMELLNEAAGGFPSAIEANPQYINIGFSGSSSSSSSSCGDGCSSSSSGSCRSQEVEVEEEYDE